MITITRTHNCYGTGGPQSFLKGLKKGRHRKTMTAKETKECLKEPLRTQMA